MNGLNQYNLVFSKLNEIIFVQSNRQTSHKLEDPKVNANDNEVNRPIDSAIENFLPKRLEIGPNISNSNSYARARICFLTF